MYHQFKELADVDITKEPMEVGPAQHYVMGGVEVDPDTGRVDRARPVRGGRGVRRHARLQPARRQLPVRPAGVRPPGGHGRGGVPGLAGRRPAGGSATPTSRRRAAEALAPLERAGGENPYTVHAEVQQTMSDLVGIIRKEDEIKTALAELEKLRARAANVSAEGGRGLQPGLAPGPGPAQHHADRGLRGPGGAGAAGEPRRAHPRRLPRDVAGVAEGQPDLLAGRATGWRSRQQPMVADARGPARPVRRRAS